MSSQLATCKTEMKSSEKAVSAAEEEVIRKLAEVLKLPLQTVLDYGKGISSPAIEAAKGCGEPEGERVPPACEPVAVGLGVKGGSQVSGHAARLMIEVARAAFDRAGLLVNEQHRGRRAPV